VFFADDNITLDRENLKALCDAIVANGLNGITVRDSRGVITDSYIVGNVVGGANAYAYMNTLFSVSASDRQMIANVYGSGSSQWGYGPVRFKVATKPSALPLFFDTMIYSNGGYDCSDNHIEKLSTVYMDGSVGTQRRDLKWRGAYWGNRNTTLQWYYPNLRGMGTFK